MLCAKCYEDDFRFNSQEGRCESTKIVCPKGYFLNDNLICEKTEIECPVGMLPDSSGECKCQDGKVLNDENLCVCPGQMEPNERGVCEAYTCLIQAFEKCAKCETFRDLNGDKKFDEECVRCRAGYELLRGSCLNKTETTTKCEFSKHCATCYDYRGPHTGF